MLQPAPLRDDVTPAATCCQPRCHAPQRLTKEHADVQRGAGVGVSRQVERGLDVVDRDAGREAAGGRAGRRAAVDKGAAAELDLQQQVEAPVDKGEVLRGRGCKGRGWECKGQQQAAVALVASESKAGWCLRCCVEEEEQPPVSPRLSLPPCASPPFQVLKHA